MYDVSAYGKLIADEIRMGSYAKALQTVLGPNSVVLDIGAGTGILSLLACQYGARRVYAIEPGDSIAVAKEAAVANGFADRIVFIQRVSAKVELPEKAHVIVSDLHGVLPVFHTHLPSIMDARERLLAPGGILIPQRESLWAAIVEAPQLYDPLVAPWEGSKFGLNLDAGRKFATNIWIKGRVRPEQLVTDPQTWCVIDYRALNSPAVSGSLNWTVLRRGTAHGFLVWFDAELANGVGFSNAPDRPETIFGSGFFPWSAPVQLSVGDTVSLMLRADLIGSDYVWVWNTIVRHSDSRNPKAEFRQSTFFGAPLSAQSLRKRANTYVPALNEDGQIDSFVLGMMDGKASLGYIAQCLSARFPSRFRSEREALARVGDLSKKYDSL